MLDYWDGEDEEPTVRRVGSAMRLRLLLIAAVTLTVGLSGSTRPFQPGEPGQPDPFGSGIYTTTGADYARIADLGFRQ